MKQFEVSQNSHIIDDWKFFHCSYFLQHLQTENETLKKTLEKVQSQLETSLEAQDQQRKVLDAINRQFGDHLNALGELQNELSAVLNTWLLHKTQWISN